MANFQIKFYSKLNYSFIAQHLATEGGEFEPHVRLRYLPQTGQTRAVEPDGATKSPFVINPAGPA